MTEDLLTMTTEATEATEEKKLEIVKKPRTPAQIAALEAARQKAFAIRAERKKEKTQASATLIEKQDPISEPEEEEVEYVKKARAKPKAKKRIVVVEESSSEAEIEIRLPKRKSEVDTSRRPAERQLKLEASMTKMFTL